MIVAGVSLVVLVALILGLLIRYAFLIPRQALKFLGRFLLVVSTLETMLIVWILVYVWQYDLSLWDLSFNDFWKEQLTSLYFLKEWLYTWFWNDLLNLVFVFLPAVVFLSVRTVFTTAIGIWFLKLSRRSN
jgi:hypothetical protein